MFWTPKWKKEAKLTIKGAKKFVNYKRDLLDEEQIKNIHARQQDIKVAIKGKDAKEVKKKCNLLEQECKKSLSSYVRPNWIAENTEVFFVAIVIALGLRAYALQPFRIPTGSMQPSLNGMHGKVLEKDEWPSFAKRQSQVVSHGRSYYNLVADKDKKIKGFAQAPKFHFFTLTQIHFDDGSMDTVYTSASAIQSLMKFDPEKFDPRKTDPEDESTWIPVKAGEAYATGYVDTGDLVLVDKVSYHFRKPNRGETFVFDTRNIKKIHADAARSGRPAGSHYIKRLVGVPGDKVSIGEAGHIYIDGKIAQDDGLEYSMGLTGFGRPKGHSGYTILGDQKEEFGMKAETNPGNYAIYKYGQELRLKNHKKTPQLSEYAAFGDNTVHSSDSRDWGKVKQYNLVGPALLSIWPFCHEDKQHWGLIK